MIFFYNRLIRRLQTSLRTEKFVYKTPVFARKAHLKISVLNDEHPQTRSIASKKWQDKGMQMGMIFIMNQIDFEYKKLETQVTIKLTFLVIKLTLECSTPRRLKNLFPFRRTTLPYFFLLASLCH